MTEAESRRLSMSDPRGQIKTRQRVRDLAEVFTHEREVKAMLDLAPDMFPHTSIKTVDAKFLEPACGSGNFLEEILRRKLAGIRFGKVKSAPRYEHWLLRALASIYGVDISVDNVEDLHADFLVDASRTEVVDYQPGRGGMFMRVWSMLDDSALVQRAPDLFHPEPEPKRDEVPVHYTALAANDEPTRAAEMVEMRGERA